MFTTALILLLKKKYIIKPLSLSRISLLRFVCDNQVTPSCLNRQFKLSIKI